MSGRGVSFLEAKRLKNIEYRFQNIEYQNSLNFIIQNPLFNIRYSIAFCAMSSAICASFARIVALNTVEGLRPPSVILTLILCKSFLSLKKETPLLNIELSYCQSIKITGIMHQTQPVGLGRPAILQAPFPRLAY
jgi:hypothetical protein